MSATEGSPPQPLELSCLSKLQAQLQRTYEVEIPHAVSDFVYHGDDRLEYEPGQVGQHAVEKVVIVERPDRQEVDLGVYLDESVVSALSDDDPTERLHDGNLEPFLAALEGVSHFLYLLWNASFSRPVSLLELELQAEVDKFVVASALYAHQRGGVPAALRSWLFDGQNFDETLSMASRHRYEKANEYAGRYCRQLQASYFGRGGKHGLVKELRRFYRLTRAQKLRHIDQSAAIVRH